MTNYEMWASIVLTVASLGWPVAICFALWVIFRNITLKKQDSKRPINTARKTKPEDVPIVNKDFFQFINHKADHE
jgi:hypothetical protein